MSCNDKQLEQVENSIDKQNVQNIKHKILVLSGKGGVGKSSFAANLAVWLSMQGKKVGLLDIDIHGPSIPKLLNLEDSILLNINENIEPIEYSKTLKVVSPGFLTKDKDVAFIWRGPMKHSVIQQFAYDVLWGELDYLVVDCPPGTGDEPLSVIQLLDDVDGAVIVTTPQQLAISDVRKSITFCKQLKLPVLGVIENMSGFICPHCNQKTDIFYGDGGKQMASDFDVPFLGCIPIDPDIVLAGDSGEPFINSAKESIAVNALNDVYKSLLQDNE